MEPKSVSELLATGLSALGVLMGLLAYGAEIKRRLKARLLPLNVVAPSPSGVVQRLSKVLICMLPPCAGVFSQGLVYILAFFVLPPGKARVTVDAAIVYVGPSITAIVISLMYYIDRATVIAV